MSEQIKPITADQVRDAATAKGITWVESHPCSLCGVPVGYVIEGNRIGYRSGCGCAWSPITERSWQDAADWINMQSHEEHRVRIAAQFGLEIKEQS